DRPVRKAAAQTCRHPDGPRRPCSARAEGTGDPRSTELIDAGREEAHPLRNPLAIPIWWGTATLTLNKLRRWDDHEWFGCAGCTRALCSWSLAFWGLIWPVFPR